MLAIAVHRARYLRHFGGRSGNFLEVRLYVYILVTQTDLLFLSRTFGGCDLGQDWLQLDFLLDFLNLLLLINSRQGYSEIPFNFWLSKNSKLLNPAMHVFRREELSRACCSVSPLLFQSQHVSKRCLKRLIWNFLKVVRSLSLGAQQHWRGDA